jgi:hemolysin activation/secretion protein
LRFDQKASLSHLSGYQFYSFVETGVAWNDGYRPSDGLSLTSAGAGVRLFLLDGLQADIGAAAPLTIARRIIPCTAPACCSR